jgi:hypothetical protein
MSPALVVSRKPVNPGFMVSGTKKYWVKIGSCALLSTLNNASIKKKIGLIFIILFN